MLNFASHLKIFAHMPPTDMRKGFAGWRGIVATGINCWNSVPSLERYLEMLMACTTRVITMTVCCLD